MNWGKLVWTYTGNGWYAHAHDNEDRIYRILRDYHGGWSVIIHYRFAHEDQELGWHRLLRDAKQEADRHHHARIAESDDDNLKAYIGRFPLNPVKPSRNFSGNFSGKPPAKENTP